MGSEKRGQFGEHAARLMKNSVHTCGGTQERRGSRLEEDALGRVGHSWWPDIRNSQNYGAGHLS